MLKIKSFFKKYFYIPLSLVLLILGFLFFKNKSNTDVDKYIEKNIEITKKDKVTNIQLDLKKDQEQLKIISDISEAKQEAEHQLELESTKLQQKYKDKTLDELQDEFEEKFGFLEESK